MDNQHSREAFSSQSGVQSSSYGQVSSSSKRSHTTRTGTSKDPQNCPHGSSLPKPYGVPIPGVIYDPLLYPRTILPIPGFHPGLTAPTGYQPSLTGLNQINPAYLLSSNDNNNCNRSRAASHSTVLEMQHHSLASPAHLPFTPYPTFLPHPYFNINRPHNPSLDLSLSMQRRNSTNTHHPHDNYALQPSQGPKFHPNTTLPLSTAHLPYHSGIYTNPALRSVEGRSSLMQQVSFRRERYSVGGPVNDVALPVLRDAPHRRNSIPTSLEVQPISDSSSVDDDDDVFDTTPTAPQTATDHATYLQELRENRKRALSGGTMSLTQSKFPCRDLPSGSTPHFLPRPRFRRRITDADEDSNASDDQKTQQKQSQLCNDNSRNERPGASSSEVEIIREKVPGEENQRSDGSDTSRTDSSTASTSEEPPKPPSLTSSKITITARNSTPSPSILKKSIRLNRHCLTQGDEVKGQGSSGENSTLESLRTKKQVAFMDDVKPSRETDTDSNVILTPISHDLLTEKNLVQVKENPAVFTAKDKIGPFIFGPPLGTSPVRSISQYLVRKENTFQYYMAKVLNLGGNSADDRSGRMLLYSEHALLTLLRNHPGVVRERGFHKDVAFNPKTRQFQERLCLIIDCLSPHEFDERTDDYLNLQQHVIKVKRLTERETIRIFMSIVSVVQSLHELNVVHRDLKLGNMVLLKKSQRIVLTNFCLGRHLMSDGELLKDQRGSPAYISPDVLSGKPYAGKPSDMWSLGVVLYMMLYGQFPFYDKEPSKLFRKIKKADFVIPSSNFQASTQINEIIRGLLTLDATRRLTADETLSALQQCMSAWTIHRFSSQELQVVPDIDSTKESSSDSEDERDAEEQQDYEEEKLTRDFRLKLLSDDEGDDSAENRSKRFGRLSHQATLPSVQHCPYDARPLTSDEIALHRRLLVNSTLGPRVQGST